MGPRPLPSFSKVLLDPSAPHLPLPDAFVRKHLGNTIPENPILRSVNGGYSWRLKMKKVGEIYCFVDGWNDVVEDSQLEFGDFLVFWLLDPSTFKLSIYGPSGCQKDFPFEYDDVNEEEEEEDDDEEEEDDDDGGGGGDIDGDDGDPFFQAVIPKFDSCRMRLPLGFARLAGIDAKRSIRMKNLDGKEWPMKLLIERHNYTKRCKYTRYYLSAGWSKFKKDNRLSLGDVCVIKFIRSQDKLYLAKLTKKRRVPPAGKVPVTDVPKRPRGRPRRVVVGSKGDGPKMVKRPRGRPRRKEDGHVK